MLVFMVLGRGSTRCALRPHRRDRRRRSCTPRSEMRAQLHVMAWNAAEPRGREAVAPPRLHLGSAGSTSRRGFDRRSCPAPPTASPRALLRRRLLCGVRLVAARSKRRCSSQLAWVGDVPRWASERILESARKKPVEPEVSGHDAHRVDASATDAMRASVNLPTADMCAFGLDLLRSQPVLAEAVYSPVLTLAFEAAGQATPCAFESIWSLVIYFDELSPGNALRPDHRRARSWGCMCCRTPRLGSPLVWCGGLSTMMCSADGPTFFAIYFEQCLWGHKASRRVACSSSWVHRASCSFG